MDLIQDYTKTYESLKTISTFDYLSFDQLTTDTNQEVALKILARFWVTLRDSLGQVQKSLETNNLDSSNIEIIRKACHKVTGSADLVGFKQFSKHSRTLNTSLSESFDPQASTNEIELYLKSGYQLADKIESSFPQIKSYL